MTDLDPDLIVDPQDNSNIKVTKDYTVDTSKVIPAEGFPPDVVTVNDGPLGDNIPGKLPEFSAVFKLVSDQATKVVSFKDIESMLLTDRGVSTESAQYLEQATGDFLSTLGYTEKYFTRTSSSVGYSEAMKHIRGKIAAESVILETTVGDLIKNFITDKRDSLLEYINNELDSLLSAVYGFAENKRSDTETILSSPNRIISMGNGFIDLGKVNLLCPDSYSIPDTSKYSNLKASFASLSELLSKKPLLGLVIYSKDNVSLDNYFKDSTESLVLAETALPISFIDLLTVFTTSVFADNVKHIYSELGNKDSDLTKAIFDLDLNAVAGVYLPEAILEHQVEIRHLMMSLHHLDVLRVLIPLFIAVMEKTVEDIKAVL